MRRYFIEVNKLILVAVTFFIILVKVNSICALPAEKVETLDNRDYFMKVHVLLANAEKQIRVIMYAAYFYEGRKTSPTNILIRDLISAKKRGVNVQVILEKAVSKLFSKDDLNTKNAQVRRVLEKGGVIVNNDPENVRTHSKLIIIDDLITVIGSTNWSFSAMARNNETAVAIFSKEVAAHYNEYFDEILAKCKR